MPSDSNTSHDLYIFDQSCLSFRGGGGGVVPLSREARSYFYTPGFPRGEWGMFFKFIYTVVRM